MSDGARAHVSAMEGQGAYNRHAAIPAAGGSFAIPLLEEAARQITLNSGDRPIVIADYGSSQGKNSLAPMQAAIAALRSRVGRERPILSATPIFRPTTSAKCSRCWRAIPKAICKAIRLSFLMRSVGRFIGASSRLVRSISDGVPMPLSGSAGYPADSRPLLHPLQQLRRPGRVRSPSCAGLGSVPVAAGRRVARDRSSGCRASRSRS